MAARWAGASEHGGPCCLRARRRCSFQGSRRFRWPQCRTLPWRAVSLRPAQHSTAALTSGTFSEPDASIFPDSRWQVFQARLHRWKTLRG